MSFDNLEPILCGGAAAGFFFAFMIYFNEFHLMILFQLNAVLLLPSYLLSILICVSVI